MSDPLSLAAAEVTVDPLGAGDPLGGSVAAAAFSSVGSVLVGGTVDEDREQAAVVSRFLTWKQRRASILKQYVVTGQLKVQSELLNVDGVSAAALGSNIDDGPASGEKKVATTLDSKTRGRLEQLEATAEAKEAHTVRLTQQELVSRVDKLNVELRKAWEGEERVRALKIAIQVSKMLGDTAFPQFFPSVFVLVTEMLDNFGAAAQFGAIRCNSPRDAQFSAQFSLTRPPPSRRRTGLRARPREGGGRQERLRRLHARADARGGRRDDEELVLQGGLRNSGAILAQFWRNSGAIRRMPRRNSRRRLPKHPYKVASIRELVPRFYVELAIIRCYRMLMPASELPTVLRRMVQMVRGFGDPLAATYARSYLVHKAMQVAPHMTQQLVQEPLWDTFTVYKQQLANETFQKKMAARVAASGTGGTLIEYFQTFIPALEWLTQVIAERNPTHDMLKEMIKLYMANCKSTLVLNCILASFEPALVSDNALAMCELIKAADATAYPKYHLYVSLGAAMCAFPPPKETQLQIINDVWAEIAKIKSAREYTPIAAQFVRFLLKEFTFDEVRKLLRDIVKRVAPEKAYLELQPQLQRVVAHVLEECGTMADFGTVFAMEPFMKLLTYFDAETQTQNCKMVLDAFSKAQGTTADPVLVSSLMQVARRSSTTHVT